MRTFATVFPYTDLSKIKSSARRMNKIENIAYSKALDRCTREETGLSWSELHPERTASILETGKLVMQWRNLTIEFGFVDELFPIMIEAVPANFSSVIVPRLSEDDDTYKFNRTLLALYFEPQSASRRGGLGLSFTKDEIARLTSPDEPLRVRCGILAGSVWASLDAVYVKDLGAGFRFDVPAIARNMKLHRQLAFDFHHDLDMVYQEAPDEALSTIVRTLTTIAPACARAWLPIMAQAASEDQEVDLLRRGVEVGDATYGPIPIERFVSNSGYADWEAVHEYLMMRRSMLETKLRDGVPVGFEAIEKLDREIERVDGLMSTDRREDHSKAFQY
jgi:hypothetical protein